MKKLVTIIPEDFHRDFLRKGCKEFGQYNEIVTDITMNGNETKKDREIEAKAKELFIESLKESDQTYNVVALLDQVKDEIPPEMNDNIKIDIVDNYDEDALPKANSESIPMSFSSDQKACSNSRDLELNSVKKNLGLLNFYNDPQKQKAKYKKKQQGNELLNTYNERIKELNKEKTRKEESKSGNGTWRLSRISQTTERKGNKKTKIWRIS